MALDPKKQTIFERVDEWWTSIEDRFWEAASVFFMIGIGFFVYNYWNEIDEAIFEPVNTKIIYPIRKSITNCDNLMEELDVDNRCLNEESCTMTREELEDHEKREEKWFNLCSDTS